MTMRIAERRVQGRKVTFMEETYLGHVIRFTSTGVLVFRDGRRRYHAAGIDDARDFIRRARSRIKQKSRRRS